MKLERITKITACLRCVTGLHIGSGDSEMHIGGIDNPVIKHPITKMPYIPGSSLKGKIRSLLEWRTGEVQANVLSWEDYKKTNRADILHILQLFGASGSDDLKPEEFQELGPTRLSFWDCSFTDNYRQTIDDENVLPTETKSENTINRIAGTAIHPRFTERVCSDAEFSFNLTFKRLDMDSDELLAVVLSGLKLLEFDSLGGSGSRGYGKIKFENLCVDGKNYQDKFDAIDPFKD